MSARRRIGDPEQFLTKRIPQNPKYQHVKTRLDTEGDAAPAENNLEIAETNGKGSPEEKPASPILFINNTGAGESYRSTLQSVISGVGELDLGKGDPKETELTVPNNGPYPDCPYLLLDKNAHGKIIILYDDDERVASQAATTMCERGFENLFMLSGGLVTGSFPASCLVASQPGSARKKATPQSPLPQAAENKWRFTAEDLQKIQYYLQEEQFPSDPASRLSRGSSARDCKAVAVKSSQNLPSANPATAPLTTRSLSSSSLQSRPWR
ncbi:hypothetical protein E2320_004414, partial [Naja naja]